MKKSLRAGYVAFACIVSIWMTGCSSVFKSEPGDFRIGHWGDTKESILEGVESDPIQEAEMEDGSLLAFECELNGVPVTAVYVFDEEDCLTSGAYTKTGVTEQPKIDTIQEYLLLQEYLTEKYGDPKFSTGDIDTVTGEDGTLIFLWEFDGTTICNQLNVQNDWASYFIGYLPENKTEQGIQEGDGF